MSSANVSTYAPSEVVAIISHESLGNHSIIGLGNEMITINRANPTWTHSTTPDVFHTRTHTADSAATATINLVQTSPSNDALFAFARYDEQYKDNRGLFAITIADKKGRSVISSTYAYVSTPQERSYGAEVGELAWTINMMDCTEMVGGNGKLSADVIAILAAAGFQVDDQWK